LRRLATCVLALAGLGALAPSALADGGGLHLTAVGEPRFPDRSFVLSLPADRSAAPDRVTVTENGRRVRDASVSPASAAGAEFGVVLVIDASNSMAGEPIADAMEAARAFAARRGKAQPLGVVTFNSDTAMQLPLTTDAGEIDAALAGPPPLRRQTHVYDGVDAAVAMLSDGGATTGSVVVLSDGSDTGSSVSLQAAAARARAAGVRVFSVGLRSAAFEPEPLQELAEGARGRYSEASTAGELTGIYDALGAALAREHLVQYRSLAEPSRRVRVRVAVEGVGVATATYSSPDVSTVTSPPYDRNDFWGSPFALVLVSLACGTFVALALFTAFSRPGRRRLRERMAQFVSPAPTPEPAEARQRGLIRGHAGRAIDSGLERMRWWPAFKQELDIAGIKLDPIQFAVATAAVTVLFAWILMTASGSVLVAVPAVVGVPLAARTIVRQRAEMQRRLFADQLADNLQVIASAQRAGHSFIGALTVSVDHAPEPTKTEFERALADERLGLPIEDGLGVVAGRMDSRDLEQVILVAKLQRETGGNTAEVLDRVADTVRERGELRRLISSLTAQGRMSRWIVTALPLVLLLLVSVINPEYMEPLFQTGGGKVALVVAGLLLFVGSLAIKRIVTIKV
jgi:tight adherence protein B